MAGGFRALVQTYGMTQEQAAEKVGKSRSAVANALRLLDLHPSIQKSVEVGQISAGHARAILPLPPSLRTKAVREIVNGGLNVRQTEKLVKMLLARSQEPADERKSVKEVDYAAEAAKSLSSKLGRACRISHGKKKGKVEIEYYGVDDLNNLLEALEGLGT